MVKAVAHIKEFSPAINLRAQSLNILKNNIALFDETFYETLSHGARKQLERRMAGKYG